MMFTPSDLTLYMRSPFAAWMERYSSISPEKRAERDPDDKLMTLLQNKGFQHEKAQEENFVREGLSVIKIEGDNVLKKKEATLRAMQTGADVIAQAYLEATPFFGYADFLIKVPGKSCFGDYYYEVWDTKLSLKAKPTFIIQLCCYSEILSQVQDREPEQMVIVLGDGSRLIYKVSDYYYYYLALKSRFIIFHEHFEPTKMPSPSASTEWGNWSGFAEKQLLAKDHLFQIANITKGQIKKLNKAGIATVQQLVDSDEPRIAGMSASLVSRLQAQAAIQKASVGSDKPHYKIIAPKAGELSGLALLPPHSPCDVFFDIEGFPLEEGGLEYLWGNTFFAANGERCFKDFWAHNRAQEKKTFQDFITWVYARWQSDPTMHIYHYANYEIAACRKLMGRYGVCEYELDQLLRNEVFIDLYKIVKACLLLGEPRYSIKNVEHLYRDHRDTEVGSGGDSVIYYEHWRTLHAENQEGDTWETSTTLANIRHYNIDDCDSTQELVMWLREQQTSHQIAYAGKTEPVEPNVNEIITQRITLRDALLVKAQSLQTDQPPKATLVENLAWLLEFHRRELKPMFWRLFDRLGLPEEDLFVDLDCLVHCRRTTEPAFKPKPTSRNNAYEYQFDPNQEFKSRAKTFYLLGIKDANEKDVKVTVCTAYSDLGQGIITLQSKHEPPSVITLVPDEYINPEPIPTAIEQVVSAYHQGGAADSALMDFLMREKPSIKNHNGGAIAPAQQPDKKLQQIIHAIKHLDHSYLPIQGPPGAGKTYTATRVIAELIRDGARVGIASNSHKAINHLLLKTKEYCDAEQINAVFVCTKDTDAKLQESAIVIVKNSQLASYTQSTCVLGTTAWGYARDDMMDTLDYLFIDEAGQVSVANLVGMSRCARNLVIMGDQMQLGQPLQGTHPADSGLSILDYLLHDAPTIADDRGVFLGTTYRMHSRINHFISHAIYDGKLLSHPDNDQRIIEVPEGYQGELSMEAGIVFVPVEHEGNTYAANEEVHKIKALALALLGRTFVESSGKSRKIGWDDMLFVAPYNYQVNKLHEALGDEAKVGSVDKFQGQEAPIVFLSMCTSDPNESPRGIEFLFDRHRLNVAISRAQSLAIVVANPDIGATATQHVPQLKLINLFNALSFTQIGGNN